MIYVLKNADGHIVAVSETEMPDQNWTAIDSKSPEYIQFLEKQLAKNSAFRESDIQLARVLEDLIAILIERNIIRFTDFPVAAQKRLNDRQHMRQINNLSNLVNKGPAK